MSRRETTTAERVGEELVDHVSELTSQRRAGASAAFTVVTGHRRSGEPDVDWRALAQLGGTIVVLMGVSQRAAIAAFEYVAHDLRAMSEPTG